MFSHLEYIISLRYLRSRRQEGFISVITGFSLLGISLGVATLIIVMAVMNGFRYELLFRILGLNGHLSLHSQTEQLSNFDTLTEQIYTLPEVARVIPTIESQVMIVSHTGAASGAILRGIRTYDISVLSPIINGLVTGSLENFYGTDVAIIGNRLADRLGVSTGDLVTLVSSKGTLTAFGLVPRMRTFRVIATFLVGMYEYDNSFIYVPIFAAQLYLNLPKDTVNYLEILLKDPDRTLSLHRDIVNLVGPSVRIYNWQQTNASFFNAIQVERNVMFLILTLIILVAAFNIVSGLVMLVKDKSRDIAILRTIGATRGMILRIFFLSGASVGIIGTTFGAILGLLFAVNIESIRQILQNLANTEIFSAEIYFLSRMPSKIDPQEVLEVVMMSLGLSFSATFYPSWRAAYLEPVEILRYG